MIAVTKEHLENLIAKKEFLSNGRITICMLTLHNGFEVVGISGVLDQENYQQNIGEQVAYDDAFKKLWSLEGYRFQWNLYEQTKKK
jgi:hypothetical protein